MKFQVVLTPGRSKTGTFERSRTFHRHCKGYQHAGCAGFWRYRLHAILHDMSVSEAVITHCLLATLFLSKDTHIWYLTGYLAWCRHVVSCRVGHICNAVGFMSLIESFFAVCRSAFRYGRTITRRAFGFEIWNCRCSNKSFQAWSVYNPHIHTRIVPWMNLVGLNSR